MEKILVLDNYDSFTYNLVHLLREIGCEAIDVVRNDVIELSSVAQYTKILLSPGPGIPSEAGRMSTLVQQYAQSKPILGICLGHQCLGEVFGGKLRNMVNVMHGKASEAIVVDRAEVLFKGVPDKFLAGRYHSWLVDQADLPDCLTVTAEDQDGNIMALRHKTHNLRGLQFHPESILTEVGAIILTNWIKEC
ncbi:aminodeoxychorismate/anthranilate synthase component II [Oligoflexia bacterium]|nr:aminodeoxychorismate/anthranilate synthase component II [Oligoflexia bacterium]